MCVCVCVYLALDMTVKNTVGFRFFSLVCKTAYGNNFTCLEFQTRRQYIIYNKPTRCNSGSIVFINNYKYAPHVSDALCVHLQEHYKL